MTENSIPAERLLQACQEVWKALRGGDQPRIQSLLDPACRIDGFPLSPFHRGEGDAAASSAGPSTTDAKVDGIAALVGFFGEGGGLTDLHHKVTGLQSFSGSGLAAVDWMAELGLGQDGSPRFVSGSATLSFRCDGSACLLRGWLGTRGPHEAQSAEERAADAAAIREQILRVFEAYRQKDQATLRRTHTADWRGFALSSAAVGKGIEAYMRAASRAMVSVQFEEYRILEFDAIFYGDIAIVPYVASVAGKTAQGRTESRLRVIDVYLRAPSGWNQTASNVCLHPGEIRGA